MDPSVAYLFAAITAIFSGKATPDTHAALNAYSESKECWTAASLLLSSPEIYVRYFAANILYSKVRKNWTQLSDSEKGELLVQMGSLMVAANESRHSNPHHTSKVKIVL
jgi:hypothetical protein